MRKWKWLIIEVTAIAIGILGFYFWSVLAVPSPIALLALVFGLYWAGYAAAQMENIVGAIKIHVQVRNWKPSISITKVERI